MTDNNTQNAQPSKTPSHVAYQVRDREGSKGFWTRIGSAWAHNDGNGFNIQLDCVPRRWTHHTPGRQRKEITIITGGLESPPHLLREGISS